MNIKLTEMDMNYEHEIEERRIAWRKSLRINGGLCLSLWLYAAFACFAGVLEVRGGPLQGSWALGELPVWWPNTSSWNDISLWLAVVLPVAYLIHGARSSSNRWDAFRSKTLLALFGVMFLLALLDMFDLVFAPDVLAAAGGLADHGYQDTIEAALPYVENRVGVDFRVLVIMATLLAVSVLVLVAGGRIAEVHDKKEE